MERRTSISAAVVVVLLVVAAVQLADPRLEERRPPEVDFSEPPAEVAADAAEQFEYVDYAYTIEVADNRSGEWQRFRTVWIDNSDREYRKFGPGGRRGVVIYGTSDVSFVRTGVDRPWHVIPRRNTLYPARLVTQPLSTKQIQRGTAHIVEDNDSVFVLWIDKSTLKFADNRPGFAVMSIHKETGLIGDVFVSYDSGQGHTDYIRLRVVENDTDVERPTELSVHADELIWDISRGPLIEI